MQKRSKPTRWWQFLTLLVIVGALGWIVWKSKTQTSSYGSVTDSGSVQNPAASDGAEHALGSSVEVQPGEASARAETQTPSVRLLVVTQGGDPIASASARAAGASAPSVDFRTASDGRVDIPCDLGVRLTLRIEAIGYLPAQVALEGSVNGDVMRITLTRIGELRVAVFDSLDKPIFGVYVEIRPDKGDALPSSMQGLPEGWPEFLPVCGNPETLDGVKRQLALTDESGVFIARGLPCDEALVVDLSGTVPITRRRALIPGNTGSAELNVHLALHGCIRGTIVFADGSAAADQPVRSFQRGSMGIIPEPITADLQGRFEICGLAAGPAEWRIESPGEVSRCTLVDAPIVDVGTIVIPRLHWTTISLSVADAPAELRFDGWLLQAFHGGRLISSVNGHRSGTTQIELPHGDVRIDLVRGGRRALSYACRVPCDPIQLELGGHLARLTIEGAPVRSGQPCGIRLLGVARAGEERLAPSRHFLAAGQMSSIASWQDADLQLWMLVPGDYRVLLSDEVGETYDLGVVSLHAGEHRRMVARPTGRGTIRGSARDGAGAPAPGVVVQACQLALEFEGLRNRRQTTKTAEDGTFELVNLSSGSWTVFPKSRGPESAEARTVEVAPGEQASIELLVGRPGVLDVEVLDAGRPCARASVRVEPRGDGLRDGATNRSVTDNAGRARFDALCEGEYDLCVSWQGATSGTWIEELRSVFVPGGEVAFLRIDSAQGLARVRFERNGEPFEDWRGAVVFSNLGRSHLRPLPGRDRISEGVLGRGAHLFLLYAPASFPKLHPDRDLNHCRIAYAPELDATLQPITVELRGADVTVRTSSPGASLPLARLIQIGPFRDVWGTEGFDRIVYEDEGPNLRRFRDIPVGAVIQLEDAGWGAVGAWTQVQVLSERGLEIEWPPK